MLVRPVKTRAFVEIMSPVCMGNADLIFVLPFIA